ncbi:MAG: hypothetical protein ACYDDZ_12930 [Acidimicrobiales bacterium]
MVGSAGAPSSITAPPVTSSLSESYLSCLTPAASPGGSIVGLAHVLVEGSQRGPGGLVPFERSGFVQVAVDFFDVTGGTAVGQVVVGSVPGAQFTGCQLYAGSDGTSFYLFQRSFDLDHTFTDTMTLFSATAEGATRGATLSAEQFKGVYPDSVVPPGSLFQLPGALLFAAGPVYATFDTSTRTFTGPPASVSLPKGNRPVRIAHTYSSLHDLVVFCDATRGALASITASTAAQATTATLPVPGSVSQLSSGPASGSPGMVSDNSCTASPDGTKLAVIDARPGGSGVWILDLPAMSSPVPVLTGQAISDVSWWADSGGLWALSPSSQVLFSANLDGTVELSVPTTNAVRLVAQ